MGRTYYHMVCLPLLSLFLLHRTMSIRSCRRGTFTSRDPRKLRPIGTWKYNAAKSKTTIMKPVKSQTDMKEATPDSGVICVLVDSWHIYGESSRLSDLALQAEAPIVTETGSQA